MGKLRSPFPSPPPRRLPRRLGPGGQKSPFVWRNVVEDWKVTCLPEIQFLMKRGEPFTLARQEGWGTHFLTNVAKGYMRNKTLAGLGGWPALFRWQGHPPGQANFSQYKHLSPLARPGQLGQGVLTPVWLVQLGERRSAERDVAGSNPSRTNPQGL